MRVPKDCLEPGRVGRADALGGCDVENDRIEGLRHRVVKVASQTLPLLHRPELGSLWCNGQLVGTDPDEQPVVTRRKSARRIPATTMPDVGPGGPIDAA